MSLITDRSLMHVLRVLAERLLNRERVREPPLSCLLSGYGGMCLADQAISAYACCRYWWGKLSLWASSSQLPTCWSIRHEASHLATGQPHTGTVQLELPLADIQVCGGGWGWCRITHWWNQALEHLLVVCLYLQQSLKVMPLLLAQHDEGLI